MPLYTSYAYRATGGTIERTSPDWWAWNIDELDGKLPSRIVDTLTYTGTGDTAVGHLTTAGTATITGTVTESFVSPYNIVVRDAVSAPGVLTHGFLVRHSLKSGMIGGRSAITSEISMAEAPTLDASVSTGYVAQEGMAWFNVNHGGIGGGHNTSADPLRWRGNAFAGNDNTWLGPGATFWRAIIGREINTSIFSGASAMVKVGLFIVQGATDRVAGTFDDAGIAFGNQHVDCPGWTYGVSFGAPFSPWAFHANSTLIGMPDQAVTGASYGTREAKYGIDLSGVTFTAGGAGVVMPLTTPASATATGKAGSIVWDANFVYVCVATDTWKRAALSTW